VKAETRIKIPSLVLSAWCEWADALKIETKVNPSRVNDFDHRVLQHSWHEKDKKTPPTSPTTATTEIIEKYNGMSFLFLHYIVLTTACRTIPGKDSPASTTETRLDHHPHAHLTATSAAEEVQRNTTAGAEGRRIFKTPNVIFSHRAG
jgi:hypothetical protein